MKIRKGGENCHIFLQTGMKIRRLIEIANFLASFLEVVQKWNQEGFMFKISQTKYVEKNE